MTDMEMRAQRRKVQAAVLDELTWLSREYDVLRGDLGRVNVQAQIAAAGVLAVMGGVFAARPADSLGLTLSGICGAIALLAAGVSLWPILKGFGATPFPGGGLDEDERDRLRLEARRQQVARVEAITYFKFRLVQVAYGAGLAGLLFLLLVTG